MSEIHPYRSKSFLRKLILVRSHYTCHHVLHIEILKNLLYLFAPCYNLVFKELLLHYWLSFKIIFGITSDHINF